LLKSEKITHKAQMGLDTSAVGQGQGSTTHYGHQDYYRDQAAGKSDAEILAAINADPSKMGNGGVTGDLYAQISAGANSGGSSGGGGGGGAGYSPGSTGIGAGGYRPGDVNFNPGGIDMGGGGGGSPAAPVWDNDDFIRGLAKERAEAFTTDNSTTSQNQSITNDIEQNIGNKGDMTTTIENNGTMTNNSIGNDYSLNLGSINVANNQNQFAV
jgi:hypothetical protein